jgi:hypothetical protein
VTSRRCKYVKCEGPIPGTARADAEFCRPEHKSAHHNEQRRSQGTTAKRLDPASGPESDGSGQILDLSEARSARPLQQPTDCQRLLIALRARGPAGLHTHEIRKLGISGNPSQRAADLEERGYELRRKREHKGRRPGVRLFLVSEPGQLTEKAA